ncbi:MAG: alanine dehydrogenase [Acidimicrobiia bacterium]|nr:alanine dehydrogenase [Acidimicrobiia bacterium]
MIVGAPAETKTDERRVAITPAGVLELATAGHEVIVEAGAGEGSGIDDEQYASAGAHLADSPEEVYERATLILHVKEPQPVDLAHLRKHHVLFTYLHLAAYPEVADALLTSETTAIAYETVEGPDGDLPLLAPMSRIAGRMAVQAGTRFLEAPQGGKGMLAGGIPGVARARVTVIGAGVVGWHAVDVAVGLGAAVTVLDINTDRLGRVEQMWGGRVETIHSSRHMVERHVTSSDLVIGAVLVAGDRAPVLVDERTVAAMEAGSVLVDVAIDQGGCFATSRETTHHEPVYAVHGVLHYCVGNMPGAVPRTSTYALTNATMRYTLALAGGLGEALGRHPELRGGVNVVGGRVVNPIVAHALGAPATDLEDVLRPVGGGG